MHAVCTTRLLYARGKIPVNRMARPAPPGARWHAGNAGPPVRHTVGKVGIVDLV